MSKSYNNFINIFLPDKKLRKANYEYETDSTPLEDPKDYSTCNVFACTTLLANEAQIQRNESQTMEGGNYG